jgi:signal transduction histidine kinase
VHIKASSCEAKTGHTGVLITVSDDGLGIPPENMGRIFEPFFTTRMARGGTGLGLSIVYNIVHDILGGTIDVRSPSGEGARFEIWLPNVAPKKADDAIKHQNVPSDRSLAPA